VFGTSLDTRSESLEIGLKLHLIPQLVGWVFFYQIIYATCKDFHISNDASMLIIEGYYQILVLNYLYIEYYYSNY
jgi:hypothetical protein